MPPSKLSCPMSHGVLADFRDQSLAFASQPPCGSRWPHSYEMYLEESPLCGSRFVLQPSSSTHRARSGCQASVNPFMPAGYLIPEFGSPMKSTSDFALAQRLRAHSMQGWATPARMMSTSMQAPKTSCSGAWVSRSDYTMPLTRLTATRLRKKLTDVRKNGELWW